MLIGVRFKKKRVRVRYDMLWQQVKRNKISIRWARVTKATWLVSRHGQVGYLRKSIKLILELMKIVGSRWDISECCFLLNDRKMKVGTICSVAGAMTSYENAFIFDV